MADQIQLRRDIAVNWTDTNPILAQAELGIETDTLKLKIGNGVDTWNVLDYHGAVGGYIVKNIITDETLESNAIVSAVTTNGGPIAAGTTLYTLTLPAAPEDEDIIQIIDGTGNSQDEPILIDRNGKLINNLTDDLTCDVNFFDIKLIYNSVTSNWALGGK